MRSVQFISGRPGTHALLAAVILLSGAILWPGHAGAEGALAVGVPSDVAKQGFVYGYVNNKASPDDARTKALDACRAPGPNKADPARPLCTLVGNYHDQCVAVAMDPKAGTPGVGWAISPDSETAKNQAIANCRATAGASRRDFCTVDKFACDGSAQ